MDARLSRCRTPSRRRDLLPAFLLGAVLLVSASPIRVEAQAGSDSVSLAWTAPGDDGTVGTAASYEIRMSTSPINDANWGSASVVSSPPSPRPSGTRENFVVRGLTRGITYYFALKAQDDASNVSGLSNVVRWDWLLDTAPPSAPTGVSAGVQASSNVRVQWSPNSEPDLAGYTVYRRIVAGGPYQPVSPGGLTSTQFMDSSIPAGTAQVWYQVSATDVSGNESARSATTTVSFSTAITAFEMQPPYPNPSRGSESVVIPLIVPTAGGAGAEVLVMDSGGHRVRTLALAGLSGGPQTVIWDGRNDGGRTVAPGVYTAWLMGAGERRSIKLVRVP